MHETAKKILLFIIYLIFVPLYGISICSFFMGILLIGYGVLKFGLVTYLGVNEYDSTILVEAVVLTIVSGLLYITLERIIYPYLLKFHAGTKISLFKKMFNDAFRKEKTAEQLFQEEIISSSISCPICGSKEFVSEGRVAPAYGGGRDIVYITKTTDYNFQIKSKYCKQCGYIVLFKKL